MSAVNSFPPIANPSAEILILGSMPGLASLKANQYYAHPRNGFWRILANIYGFNAEFSYENRVKSLIASKVAVWDVLKSCERQGSLDSAIIKHSRLCNDFETFLKQHPNIQLIAFNGKEAEKIFNRLVLPKTESLTISKNFINVYLPSSSPTNTQTLEEKVNFWKKALSKDG